MNATKLNQFIRSFCSEEEFRTNLTKPNYYDNGYIAASDSISLVLMHAPDFDKTDCLNSQLGIWTILDPFSKYYGKKEDPIGILDFSKIKSVISEATMIPEYRTKYRECDECDGTGEVECECCGNESDCEKCRGKGEITVGKEETGYYKYPDDKVFVVNDILLGMPAMGKLSERLSIIDANELWVYHTVKTNMIFFQIKATDIYILQMGVLDTDKEKIKIELIKTN